MNNNNLKKAVEKYGKLYIKELMLQLIKLNKKATGKLIDSLDYEIITGVDSITISILSEPYLKDIDQGRKKGKLPDGYNIQKWMKAKHIKIPGKTIKESSWIISHSIKNKGIDATYVISKAKDNFLKNKTALDEVLNAATFDVSQFIDHLFQNIK